MVWDPCRNTGLMYGGLELGEVIHVSGMRAIRDVDQNPYMALLGTKCRGEIVVTATKPVPGKHPRGEAVGGVVVVGESQRVRDALVPVYRELGFELDPASAGSVEDETGPVTVEATGTPPTVSLTTSCQLRILMG